MSNVFGVRTRTNGDIDKIVFAENLVNGSLRVANCLAKDGITKVRISDGTADIVLLYSKQHALDLKKALDKAIELGWLV